MPIPFSRTLRALHESAPRRLGVLAVLVVLLVAWGGWAFAGKVSIVVTSRRARFESGRAVRQLAAPASGRVQAVNIALGDEVRAGDVLLELDAGDAAIRRARAEANTQHIRRRIVAIRAQIASTRASAVAQKRAGQSRVAAARETQREAMHLADIEEARAARLRRLAADGLIPATEAEDARARADAERARVRSLAAVQEQVAREHAEKEAALEAAVHELESDRIDLETRLVAEEAALREADLQIERLRVRAPAAGRIDSFAELRPGVWVAEGTVIGSVTPVDPSEVTAYFGLGDMPLVRAGQPAVVWLEALEGGGRRRFPAVVRAVERNPNGDEFRVHVRLTGRLAVRERVEQGFPVVATIEVLRLSPFRALLRAAGMLPAQNAGV